jgi:AsmA protein
VPWRIAVAARRYSLAWEIDMKTLKIATIGIVVVLVTAVLALVLGVPAGLVVGALQNRVEAGTGYRLRIVGNSTLAFWPAPTLTVRDISLFDANDADPLGKLTAESMRFSITLSSLFAGYPQISEIAIARADGGFYAAVDNLHKMPFLGRSSVKLLLS